MRIRLLFLLFCASALSAGQFKDQFAFVTLDERSEQSLGAMPVDRAVIARAVTACKDAQAKAVVLKFFYDLPKSEEGDAALARAIAALPVALQARLEGDEAATTPLLPRFAIQGQPRSNVSGDRGWIPLPLFQAAASHVGFVDFTNFEVPTVEIYQGVHYKSLIINCLELAYGVNAVYKSEAVMIGERYLPVDLANVFHASLVSVSVEAISLVDLIKGDTNYLIRDKVVILGWDSPKTPSITVEGRTVAIHRFFVECLASAHGSLKPF